MKEGKKSATGVCLFLTKHMFMCSVCLCCVLISFRADAADPVIINCVETPEIRDISETPTVFNLSNNLARKVGSPLVAQGELIYLTGRVTDGRCRPLGNVSVFVWQADANGYYAAHSDHDKNFYGSGKSTTDNLGNFSFITVLPGQHLGRDARLHFLLKHSNFPDFRTEMFFDDISVESDSDFSRIPDAMKKLLTARQVGKYGGVKIYEFNITFADDVSVRSNE